MWSKEQRKLFVTREGADPILVLPCVSCVTLSRTLSGLGALPLAFPLPGGSSPRGFLATPLRYLGPCPRGDFVGEEAWVPSPGGPALLSCTLPRWSLIVAFVVRHADSSFILVGLLQSERSSSGAETAALRTAAPLRSRAAPGTEQVHNTY